MTDHTPTPWILDGTSVYYLDWDGESYEGRGKDYRQQLTNRFWFSLQGQPRRIPKEELEANAAFIVKAVNNHEALVKALTDLSRMYAHAWDRVDGGLTMFGASVERFEKAHHAAQIAVCDAAGKPRPVDFDDDDDDDLGPVGNAGSGS